MRAISRFASRSRALFSSAPVTVWKRRLKSSCRVSASFRSRSSSVSSRRCLALKEISLPLHELRPDRQLLTGEPQGLARERLGNTGQLEHHAARLDHRHPVPPPAPAPAPAPLGPLLRHPV